MTFQGHMKGTFKNIASLFLEIDTTGEHLFLSTGLQMLQQNNDEATRDKSNVSLFFAKFTSSSGLQLCNTLFFTTKFCY